MQVNSTWLLPLSRDHLCPKLFVTEKRGPGGLACTCRGRCLSAAAIEPHTSSKLGKPPAAATTLSGTMGNHETLLGPHWDYRGL